VPTARSKPVKAVRAGRPNPSSLEATRVKVVSTAGWDEGHEVPFGRAIRSRVPVGSASDGRGRPTTRLRPCSASQVVPAAPGDEQHGGRRSRRVERSELRDARERPIGFRAVAAVHHGEQLPVHVGTVLALHRPEPDRAGARRERARPEQPRHAHGGG